MKTCVSLPPKPTKPPQLVVLPVVSSLPSNTQPVMFSGALRFSGTNPPWVPSPSTLLWMTTLLRQFSIFTVPQSRPMKPAAYLAEV